MVLKESTNDEGGIYLRKLGYKWYISTYIRINKGGS